MSTKTLSNPISLVDFIQQSLLPGCAGFSCGLQLG